MIINYKRPRVAKSSNRGSNVTSSHLCDINTLFPLLPPLRGHHCRHRAPRSMPTFGPPRGELVDPTHCPPLSSTATNCRHITAVNTTAASLLSTPLPRHCRQHHCHVTAVNTTAASLPSTPLPHHCHQHHCRITAVNTTAASLPSTPLPRHCHCHHLHVDTCRDELVDPTHHPTLSTTAATSSSPLPMTAMSSPDHHCPHRGPPM
jgi:hypothetical protein